MISNQSLLIYVVTNFNFWNKGTELEFLMHLGSMELDVNLTKFL